MCRSTVLASVCAFLLAGCAVHPLPENVTRDTTYDIVQKIRCEGREALDAISVRLLRTSPDPTVLAFADRVEAGTLTVIDLFEPKGPYIGLLNQVLPKWVLELFKTYTTSAVTFDFDFMITENNHNGAIADFRMPIVAGLFSLGAHAGANFDRQSHRKFQIVNSFYELHHLSRDYCSNIVARIGNFAYPITGKIGLEEVFSTFVDLDSNVEGGIAGDAHRFSDQLTFTTTVSADVTPSIVLDPLPTRAFRLADASYTASAFRQDQHGVTIAVAKGQYITSLDQARADAKKRSKDIADQIRTEDFFIVPHPH
jgi:hypothetical protein